MILSNLIERSKYKNPTNLVRFVPVFCSNRVRTLQKGYTRLPPLTFIVRKSQTILIDFRFLQDLPFKLMARSRYPKSTYIIACQFSAKGVFLRGRHYSVETIAENKINNALLSLTFMFVINVIK